VILLERAVLAGAEIDELRDIVHDSRSWTSFINGLLELIRELEENAGPKS
jgi:dihydrodipicolinate reductase